LSCPPFPTSRTTSPTLPPGTPSPVCRLPVERGGPHASVCTRACCLLCSGWWS
jgi:hypothetical protein